MKKLLFIGVLLLGIAIAGLWSVKAYFFSQGPVVVVQIEPGQNISQISKILKKEGIVRSELLFKLILRLTVSPKDIKAGTFDLRKNMADLTVINCLKSSHCSHYEKITILEGWRSEEIAEALAERNITNGQAFLDIVRQKQLEGYLYPSTYLFSQDTPPQKVVDEFLNQYKKNIEPLFQEFPTDLTENQVLTIASIVEREAVHHEERPKIAAVYLNRFRINKKLEADPTVQYALGFSLKENRYWKKGLTLNDLRTDHPYNTYQNVGLPPGPICNPSAASVKGVLNPETDFEALYFVADSGGYHVFSRTYEEHLAHIKRIRGR